MYKKLLRRDAAYFNENSEILDVALEVLNENTLPETAWGWQFKKKM